jgi:hypothetical protein
MPPRALCFCFAIVAAFQLPAAAAPVEDIPIPPSVVALADRLGVDLAHSRAYFIADIARLLYTNADSRPPVLGTPGATENPSAQAVSVPIPLPAAVWSRAVFRRAVPPNQLIVAILSDRRATLVARGLAGLDDETLNYFVEHPQLLTFLYERAAAPFAAFGDDLRIHQGRVVPPGGEPAVPLWEAAIKAPVTAPDLFVRLLFGEFDGRLAYLYDAIDAAPPAAAAFALGFWISDDNQRVQRFRVLSLACANGYREWRPSDHPFSRPLGDLALLLLRLRTDESGTPSAPASRAFWAEAFDVDPNTSGSTDAPFPGGSDGPIDAAWMVTVSADLDMYSRNDRLDQFSFGQRVFRGQAGSPAATVLRQFRSHRMLLVTLERLGIRAPATYQAALQRASALASANSGKRFWTLAQYQGALALVARMHAADVLSDAAANALVLSLSAVPLQDGEYDGGIAFWMRSELAKSLPREATWEGRVMAAMSGPSNEGSDPRILWEGQNYRLDLAGAERQRLEVVRRKQAGHTIDLAFAIDDIARLLRSSSLTVESVQRAALAAKATADESASRLRNPSVNLLPPAVDPPRDGFEWLNDAATELSKITRPGDVRRAARVGASLNQLADIVLADSLVSFAYAADIGDPDGAALLAGNVALRHDFGFGRKDNDMKNRMPWLIPRQDFQPGVPWHVTGSLLGLDVALAPMNLRRMSFDRIADAPKLSSVEREALAVSVNLIEPLRLKDADRDAIAISINRGRERVQALVAGGEPLERMAETLGFDGWRRRALAWSLQHEPQSVPERFSLVELLELGGGAKGADLDAWGTSAINTDGCTCTKLPSIRAWRLLDGRPQFAMMAATMGDFNLAMAMMLREMQLPSLLAKPVMTVAMQDFIDELSPANSNDWWSLSRAAQALRRQRVEDYVSVAAAVDGPLVPDNAVSSEHP